MDYRKLFPTNLVMLSQALLETDQAVVVQMSFYGMEGYNNIKNTFCLTWIVTDKHLKGK